MASNNLDKPLPSQPHTLLRLPFLQLSLSRTHSRKAASGHQSLALPPSHPHNEVKAFRVTEREVNDAASRQTSCPRSTSNERQPIVQSDFVDSSNANSPIKWRVQWHKEPTWMMLLLFGGLAVAVTHHVYYASLNGTKASSGRHQQWALAIGNAFAVLVAMLLRAASTKAYNQYLWMTVRAKLLRVRTLDKLFALTSNPWAFIDHEVLRKATVPAALAFISW